jgi:hypothetical protein
MSKRDAVFWPLLALIRQTVQSHEFVGLISPDYQDRGGDYYGDLVLRPGTDPG